MKRSETEKINRIVRGTFIIHTFKSFILSVRIIKYCQFKETGVCVKTFSSFKKDFSPYRLQAYSKIEDNVL